MTKIIISSFAAASFAFGGPPAGDFLESIGTSPVSFDGDDATTSSPLQFSPNFSVDADLLVSDDINVQRYTATLGADIGATSVGLTYSRIEYQLDVTGTGTFPTSVNESTDQLSLSFGREWTEHYSSTLALSGYNGFTNHRSIWIDELTTQRLGGAPGFREADPFGFSVNFTNTFLLPNKFDSIAVSVGYSRDRIAPGQAFEFSPTFFGVVSGDDTLDTVSASITGSFYLTNKITSQWFARAAFVSDREVRTQYRVSTAWNITDGLTLRSEVGATFEPTDFQSYFGGLTLSYQIIDPLRLSIGYRLYTDTGEITTSNFNSAAPGFDSSEISASLLWTQGSHSFRTSVAFLQGDFDAINSASEPFEDLFSDRNFFAVRAAYTFQF